LERYVSDLDEMRSQVDQLISRNFESSPARKPYGDSIDKFQIIDLIGKGSSGKVYKAFDRYSKSNVALKIIDKTNIKGSGILNRIKKEVEIHYQLKHENIAELFSFFEDSSNVYLVQELCDSGELYSYLQNNYSKFTNSYIKTIFRQIIEGILYLHKHGIIHRDLSWSNILLCNEGSVVKISDFGVATVISSNELACQHTVCGTPNFISPEVASNQPYGLSSDIWSLGCILYTLFVGTPPFHSKDMVQSMKRAIIEPIYIPKGIPPDGAALISDLLDKNPVKRPDILQIINYPYFNLKSSSDSGFFSVSITKNQHFSNASNFKSIQSYQSKINDNCKQLKSFDAMRLHDFSLRTKTSYLSITMDHWVIAETLDRNLILRISPDCSYIYGKNITVSSSDCHQNLSDQLVPYTLINLPKIFHKLYRYAFKFVDLLSSKTPKITYLENQFEAFIMENDTFEFRYSDLIISANTLATNISLSQKNRKVQYLKSFDDLEFISSTVKYVFRIAKEYHSKLFKIKSFLQDIPGSHFPAVFGAKSKCINNNSNKNPKNSSCFQSSSSSMNSFHSLKYNFPSNCFASTSKFLYLENIGLVSANQSECIVHFTSDNSRLHVTSSGNVEYQNDKGQIFDKTDKQVRLKLQMLPAVLKEYNMQICGS